MLPEIVPIDVDLITLVGNSGIQFMDFGLTMSKSITNEFITLSNNVVTRLILNDMDDTFFYRPTKSEFKSAKPQFDFTLESSLKHFDGQWLPLPLFRCSVNANLSEGVDFHEGPINWARFRLIKLATPDMDGYTHRMTLAIDTKIMKNHQHTADLYPNSDDVGVGSYFSVATDTYALNWFLTQQWITEWVNELYKEANKDCSSDEIEEDIKNQYPVAHYLGLLSLMAKPIEGKQIETKPLIFLPKFKMIDNGPSDLKDPIPVDLILDVGNSRTCGILIEDHGQSGSGLMHNYVLRLRDLTDPEKVYTEAFESRVEFSQAFFGKNHLSSKSGRHDAFQWPTIARIGGEANRLAGKRRGSEGSTGLSSPKRYLWDEKYYTHGWYFNGSYVQDINPPATAAPFANYIDRRGEALHTIEDEMDRIPVFTPDYSRSSLMTFMLAEVLTQALSQINSPEQRIKVGHAARPRQLRNIILTVPPGMPMAERCILDDRMHQAVGLVWKSLRWHSDENDPYQEQQDGITHHLSVPLPKIRVEWDEASCAQLVYLYTEINENFAGHPESFFNMLARPGKKEKETVTIASIDIGGGTTDLVITDYRLDRNGDLGGGTNVHIIPQQRFRDSFKVAGDDILLQIIQNTVLPCVEKAFREAGVSAVEMLISRLAGSQNVTAAEGVLRQQLTLQVFVPLALHILRCYEKFDPNEEQMPPVISQTFGELLADDSVSESVKNYVRREVQKEGGVVNFDLNATTLTVSMGKLHHDFSSKKYSIDKVLSALCEVVSYYSCDLLLLTGRPSRLPGIQAIIRRNVPLPPSRILPLHGYKTGTWYPFHKNGKIDDPKSSASVGAMISQLCANHSIANFHFSTSALKPYSTIRHIGFIDMDNLIYQKDVVYADIRSDEGQIILPVEVNENGDEVTPAIVMRGDIRLGFRQLDAERWSAAPLYTLRLNKDGLQKFSNATTEDGNPPHLKVRLTIDRGQKAKKLRLISDRMTIATVESNTNKSFSKRDLELELNTMPDTGLIDNRHWLDSGSIKK